MTTKQDILDEGESDIDDNASFMHDSDAEEEENDGEAAESVLSESENDEDDLENKSTTGGGSSDEGSSDEGRSDEGDTEENGEKKQPRILADAPEKPDKILVKMTASKEKMKNIRTALIPSVAYHYGYSEELANYFLEMFSPSVCLEFFEANETQRPLTLRINTIKADKRTLMNSLTKRGMNVKSVDGNWTKVGLKVLQSEVPVGATPEYLAGQYMIQAAASLLPVLALNPQKNDLVLDMAAAPGGKTTHLSQMMENTGVVYANDSNIERCNALNANCHRLGCSNVVVCNHDGRNLLNTLPRLNKVLLDAPCTGTGIISRDPSIKGKRTVADFLKHSELQKEMLNTAIDMVDAKGKDGGYIVYSTCSVSIEENELVVNHALKTRSVKLVALDFDFGTPGFTNYRGKFKFHPSLNLTKRFYPHVENLDGFFVAKFRKISNVIPNRIKKDRKRQNEHVLNADSLPREYSEQVVNFEEKNEETTKPSIAVVEDPNNTSRKKRKKQNKVSERQKRRKLLQQQ